MDCKEHLLYFFMKGTIRLSEYDSRFLSNLLSIIDKKNKVTSNQADLFDKLVNKYARQLTKQGFHKDTLLSLVWKTEVVPSSDEYTGALVKLVDDELQIRVPFNKKFIQDFRKDIANSFIWDADLKIYRSPFNTSALKAAWYTLPKFFPSLTFSDNLHQLVADIKSLEGLFWQDIMLPVNGRVMFSSAYPILHELVDKIGYDITFDNLHRLSLLGVEIHGSLTANRPDLKFASEFHTEVDIDDFDQVIEYIKQLGDIQIYVARNLPQQSHLRDKFNSAFRNAGLDKEIVTFHKTIFNSKPILHLSFSRKSAERYNPLMDNVIKYVYIKNSHPVEVK